MLESFWWWQCSNRYILSLFPHLHTHSPFSLSLVSLMVSVEVKHYVYQRSSIRKATNLLLSLQSRYHVTFLSCLTVWRFPKLQQDRHFSCFFGQYQSVWTKRRSRLDCGNDSLMLQMMWKDKVPYRLSSLSWTLFKTENHPKSDITRCLPKNYSRGRLTPLKPKQALNRQRKKLNANACGKKRKEKRRPTKKLNKKACGKIITKDKSTQMRELNEKWLP